jgi:hypothetical protein
MERSFQQSFKNIERLIYELHESVQTELTEFKSEMYAVTERIEAAVRRNSGMIAGGTRAIGSLSQWSRSRDSLDMRRDADIRDLRARVRKLEAAMKRKKSS